MEMLLDFHAQCNTDPNVKALVDECTVDPSSLPRKESRDGNDPRTPAVDYDADYLTTILRMPNQSFELTDVTTSDELGNPPITTPGSSDFLDPLYEDEYLTTLDEQLAHDELFSDPNKPLEKPKSRILPGDKDLANQNSDSVLSWLRRHHPETFIQEKDMAESKPEKKPRGSNKRASLAQSAKAEIKAEPEGDGDEEGGGAVAGAGTGAVAGAVAGAAGSAEASDKWRGRKHRMTKDDEAYRPKGGSSRGSKRKREDADPKASGRGKRAKGQPAAAA
jgi:IEC3 subunit of the Ino80 complex, chromatin re-modelling